MCHPRARSDQCHRRAPRTGSSLLAAVHERRGTPRWVVAELDVDGKIDDHAAMCLRQAIDGVCAGSAELVRIDLRDLTAIDDMAVGLFVRASADCRSSGVQLELVICGHPRHDGRLQRRWARRRAEVHV